MFSGAYFVDVKKMTSYAHPPPSQLQKKEKKMINKQHCYSLLLLGTCFGT
jgi:hypothetical protein